MYPMGTCSFLYVPIMPLTYFNKNKLFQLKYQTKHNHVSGFQPYYFTNSPSLYSEEVIIFPLSLYVKHFPSSKLFL